MMNDPFKEITYMPDLAFPVNVFINRGIYLHWHNHMEWIYVRSGKARMQIDAAFVQLHEGELAFVNSKQLHGAEPLDDHTELIALVFNEALVRNSGLDSTEDRYFEPILSHSLQFPNFLNGSEPLTKEISEAFSRLVEEFMQKRPGFELLIKSELFRIFGLMFRHNGQLDQTRKNRNRYRREHDFTALLQYLRGHFQQEITVNEAARQVNMSPNHFCSTFKKVTGKTLIEYLHLLRIQEAERLLRDTSCPVTEIAEKVGFGSITYFGRIFRKIKHCSPSEMRKS